MDEAGHVYIAYTYWVSDTADNHLMLATNASGPWVSQTLDDSGDVGIYNDIAIDSDGHVHISYVDWGNTWSLKYVTNATGSWVSEYVDAGVSSAEYTSIAVDSSGHPHIAYFNSTSPGERLSYAEKTDAGWIYQLVDGTYNGYEVGYECSIAIDQNGYSHISYYKPQSDTYEYLGYACNIGGVWTNTTLDWGQDVGWATSIAVDQSNHVHISYVVGGSSYDLKYITNKTGSWVNETVDLDCSPSKTSIVLDSSGDPVIAFKNTSWNYVSVAKKSGGSWTNTVVDAIAGNHMDIALASNDDIQLTYNYDYKLYYATNGVYTDTTDPIVRITSPTSSATYNATSSTINLAGTCADDVRVTSVTYVNDRGGSGTTEATYGYTQWSLSGVALSGGTNVITVTAHDAAGHTGTDVITVSYAADTTKPVVTITTPTSNDTYQTTASYLASWDIAGTASDNVGVSSVTCRNMNTGSTASVIGTTSWHNSAALALNMGTNVINVTATDAAGNSGWDTVTVYRVTAIDVADPTVAITSPSSSGTYSTADPTVSLAGTASDDVGVTQVTWSNALTSGSGTCSGTNTWTASGIALQAGDNLITVTASDAVGNTSSATITVTYTVDTTDPTVSITSPSEGFETNSTSVDVGWTGNDDVGVQGYKFGIDGGDWSGLTSATAITCSGLADGRHNVSVMAIDTTGNTAVAQVNFTVDTTAPVLAITAPADRSYTNIVNVSVSWTASDATTDVQGYQYRIGSGPWSSMGTGTSNTFTGLADGVYVVSVRAYDDVNNVATATVNFTVDTGAPTAPTIDPAEGALVNSTGFSWTSSDSLSGISYYKYRMDGGAWSAATTSTTHTFNGLADGHHTLQIRAYDRSGNTADSFVNFTLDSTAPVLDVSSPGSGFVSGVSSVSVDWNGTDAVSGVTGYQYSIDGGAWSPISVTETHEFTGLAEGLHTVAIRAFDLAGNKAETNISFYVDLTAPVLTISSPANNTRFSSSSVEISWSATDAVTEVAGYRYRIDGGAWSVSSMAAAHAFSGLTDGSHKVDIEAFDAANNSVVKSVYFSVDTAAPVIAISGPTSNATYTTNSSALAISGTGTDNIGIASISWTNSKGGSGNATLTGGNWSASSIVLKEGTNVITVTATDATGNTASSTLTVTYAPDGDDDGSDSGLGLFGMISIAIVAMLGVLLIFFLVVRRKKKKKE